MAESFGSDAERYDRARPRYPIALADRILAESPRATDAGRDVLDVGIGTGISALPFGELGAHVLGVEADARMAEYARHRGFDVEIAKFEDWDEAGRTFDTVIAGQAWHWIDPVIGAQKAAAVLRPAGLIAVFWNVMQFPTELGRAFDAVIARTLPESPFAGISVGVNAYGGQFDKASQGIRATESFTEPEQWRFDWQRVYSRDEWLDGLPTSAGFDRLPPEKIGQYVEGIGEAIDAVGGRFTMDYATVAVTASRR
jgi:SAM-dependent methyltransferase